MRRYFCFVASHPVPVLTLMGAVALVFGALMFRLTRDTSPDGFIPASGVGGGAGVETRG